MMRDSAEIISILAAKEERCRALNLTPSAFLISNEDYQTLKESLSNKGIAGDPDRLRLTVSGTPYPLYTPDAEKVSVRTGQLKEPMVVI